MLSPNYLDPGTLDCRHAVGCYKGSMNEWTEERRRENAALNTSECGIEGVCRGDNMVRL